MPFTKTENPIKKIVEGMYKTQSITINYKRNERLLF